MEARSEYCCHGSSSEPAATERDGLRGSGRETCGRSAQLILQPRVRQGRSSTNQASCSTLIRSTFTLRLGAFDVCGSGGMCGRPRQRTEVDQQVWKYWATASTTWTIVAMMINASPASLAAWVSVAGTGVAPVSPRCIAKGPFPDSAPCGLKERWPHTRSRAFGRTETNGTSGCHTKKFPILSD